MFMSIFNLALPKPSYKVCDFGNIFNTDYFKHPGTDGDIDSLEDALKTTHVFFHLALTKPS